METDRTIARLDTPAWRERLEQLGRLDPAAVQPDDDPAWHEPMIREAEQNGNAFAAIWHLDRLIAARPDDWFLYARRARAWSLSDKFDKAAADYQQAERLGSREQVLDFQAHCVLDCTKAGRWAEALWYLDRLIAARPDDGSLHEDRAAVYGKLGREADRQAELARVFELGADEGLVIPRAEELGRAGRWAEAAGLLARCGRTGPLSRELAQAWGIACLKAGDRAGYREACAAFMACQGPDPTVVWNALSRGLALRSGGRGPGRLPGGRSRWFESRLSAAPAPPTHVPALVLERSGRPVAPRRPDGRGDRPRERGNRRREGNGNSQRLGLPGPGPRAKGEPCRSPPVARTPPRCRVPIRRHPSGISRSLPSSGARPSRCSSMPSFRVIRFMARGRDEPRHRLGGHAVAGRLHLHRSDSVVIRNSDRSELASGGTSQRALQSR